MSVEIYRQRDAPTIIRDKLRQLIPDVEFVAVTDDELDVWQAPYVTVVGDGTPDSGRATTSENVRATAYAASPREARYIASHVDALLQTPGIPWGFSITPGPGLLIAADEDTGGYVASVTVVAHSPKEGISL